MDDVVESDQRECAERKLIKNLRYEFLKRGNRMHNFSSWLHRKHGVLIVCRHTSYGDGISIPCVMCRKVIDKYNIKWIAHDGEKWVHSNSENVPNSRPTNKQRNLLGFGRLDDQT